MGIFKYNCGIYAILNFVKFTLQNKQLKHYATCLCHQTFENRTNVFANTIFRVSNYGGTKIGNITQRLLVGQVTISLTTRKFNYPKLFMVSNVYNIMVRSN